MLTVMHPCRLHLQSCFLSVTYTPLPLYSLFPPPYCYPSLYPRVYLPLSIALPIRIFPVRRVYCTTYTYSVCTRPRPLSPDVSVLGLGSRRMYMIRSSTSSPSSRRLFTDPTNSSTSMPRSLTSLFRAFVKHALYPSCPRATLMIDRHRRKESEGKRFPSRDPRRRAVDGAPMCNVAAAPCCTRGRLYNELPPSHLLGFYIPSLTHTRTCTTRTRKLA
ncbi:hypothetical protein C8Q80DRAFT_345947 [Daedaleopsis nitida]|nr:hypothetical protein C8Q80DRAFT_345947 [Daedaleopsis nitida]